MDYAFSENLKRIRKSKGLTQSKLAKKSHISQALICQYENNLRYPPLDKVYDLANALGSTIEELVTTTQKVD